MQYVYDWMANIVLYCNVLYYDYLLGPVLKAD